MRSRASTRTLMASSLARSSKHTPGAAKCLSGTSSERHASVRLAPCGDGSFHTGSMLFVAMMCRNTVKQRFADALSRHGRGLTIPCSTEEYTEEYTAALEHD
eukprot:1196588-Rhodomonas_salina.5